jgi:GNAT superfamily N-acetyltransferase
MTATEKVTTLVKVIPEGLYLLRPLFQRYFDEVKYPGQLDMRTLSRLWSSLISKNAGTITAANWFIGSGGPEGLVGTNYCPDTFNGEMTATMTFLYVVPEARGRGIGRTLLDFAEEDARQHGCTSIVHGHMFTIDEDGGKAIFEKRGYEVAELGFRKRL